MRRAERLYRKTAYAKEMRDKAAVVRERMKNDETKWPTDVEWKDGEERRWGTQFDGQLPAAYRSIIGPAPKLSGGDHAGARVYLARIEIAIREGHERGMGHDFGTRDGGLSSYTRSEWRRLNQLRDTWRYRASGNDLRFNKVGTSSRPLTKQQREEIDFDEIYRTIMWRAKGSQPHKDPRAPWVKRLDKALAEDAKAKASAAGEVRQDLDVG